MTFVKFNHHHSYPEKVINRLFANGFNDAFDNLLNHGYSDSSTVRPAVNISETAEAYVLDLAAPGMKKDDFKIHLEKDVLSVSTEKKTKESNEGSEAKSEVKYSRKEFGYHSFKRSFTLPATADKEKISAEYQDGILSVTIAKKQLEEEKVKEIKIS